MRRRNKIATLMRLKTGFVTKCWQNIRTGEVLPTNWKMQAGYLSGPMMLTTRQKNRRARALRAREDYFARMKQAVA